MRVRHASAPPISTRSLRPSWMSRQVRLTSDCGRVAAHRGDRGVGAVGPDARRDERGRVAVAPRQQRDRSHAVRARRGRRRVAPLSVLRRTKRVDDQVDWFGARLAAVHALVVLADADEHRCARIDCHGSSPRLDRSTLGTPVGAPTIPGSSRSCSSAPATSAAHPWQLASSSQRFAAAGIDATVQQRGPVQRRVPATDLAVAAAAARGVDISAHRSRMMTADDVADADLIIGMARHHVREAVLLEPASLARAFTLRELVRRAQGAPRLAERAHLHVAEAARAGPHAPRPHRRVAGRRHRRPDRAAQARLRGMRVGDRDPARRARAAPGRRPCP